MEGGKGLSKDEGGAECAKEGKIKIDFIPMPNGIIRFCAPPKYFEKSKKSKKAARPPHPSSKKTSEKVDDLSKLMQKLHFASSRQKAISSRRSLKEDVKDAVKPKPSLWKDSTPINFVGYQGFPRKRFSPTTKPSDILPRSQVPNPIWKGRHQNICQMSDYSFKSFEEVRCEDYLAGWKGSISTNCCGPKFKPTKENNSTECIQVITASYEYSDRSLEELRMEHYMPSIAWKHRQKFSLSSGELKKLPVTIGSTAYIFMQESVSKRKGIIRYIGRLPKKPAKETFAGIEYEDEWGVCDGRYEGVRFFRTKDQYAEFVPIDSVLPGYMISEEKRVEKNEPSKTKSDDGQEIRCSICLENPIKIIFLPCCHYVTCESCSKKVDKCPICRKRIASKNRVYVSGR